MNTTKLPESQLLKAWGLFFLIATVGGFVVGAIGGLLVSMPLVLLGVKDPQVFKVAGAVIGFLLSLPVSYAAFRYSVSNWIVPHVQADEQPQQAQEQPRLASAA